MATNMEIDESLTENKDDTSMESKSPDKQSLDDPTPSTSTDVSYPKADGKSPSKILGLHPIKQIMAPSTTVGSVSISLHPLVILNVSDHWTREKTEKKMDDVRVFGALIGKQTGRNIEIMNSYELLIEEIGPRTVLNVPYYELKVEQFKQVFSEMDILGWYTTGGVPTLEDINIHDQLVDLMESPIMLKLNPRNVCTDLPIKVYESIVDNLNESASVEELSTAHHHLLVELPYTMVSEEAERIGIDHVARVSSHDTIKSSLVGDNLRPQYNAIKMLSSRVHLIAEFVRATKNGEIPFDPEILRQISALSHRLPILNNDKFKEQFLNQMADVSLMAYLGSITKSCNTLNNYMNKFNQMHEKVGSGRRMRGLFF